MNEPQDLEPEKGAPEDESRRRLLKIAAYVPPAIVSILTVRPAHAAPPTCSPSCNPNLCPPVTGCEPNCGPSGP